MFLQVLDAGGAVQRSVALTTGAFVTESVSVAMLGTDAVVAWTLRGADGTFRLRRVNLETGVAGPPTVIAGFGYEVSQASLRSRSRWARGGDADEHADGGAHRGRAHRTCAHVARGVVCDRRVGAGRTSADRGARRQGTFGVGWADETPVPMQNDGEV